MNPAGKVGNDCASSQLGMSIKGGESSSNAALPHLGNNWIQNPQLEHFWWELLLHIAEHMCMCGGGIFLSNMLMPKAIYSFLLDYYAS